MDIRTWRVIEYEQDKRILYMVFKTTTDKEALDRFTADVKSEAVVVKRQLPITDFV